MTDYGAQDTSTTTLGANQFPISEVWTPNSGFSATEGGTQSTDGGGKKSAPVSVSTKDGSNVTQGAKTDAAATDNTSSWSMIALLKGIAGKLLTSVAVTQSGTWTVQPGNTANTTAWKVDGSAVTQPVSGTVTSNPAAATTGGSTPYHTISAASTNATSLKASAGTLYGLSISNSNAAARFFKLYNKASAPTVGTDTPIRTIQLPGNATVITAFPMGLNFSTGIAWALTTGIADADTGAVGTDISVDLDYK